ncbi:hypothetical protein O181_027138 [Austropuccinia psidii MF-1]|uniref:Uncharacterized protein n=1 Tax=Austropuccinia psidii MF-1 TaxID=1389203 RepID=A0A9Q3CR78_9BASI|nr:hypothetical protein [Austropuccinia psidii MF-1]
MSHFRTHTQSQTCEITPQNWFLRKFKPKPIYGQLGHILNLTSFDPSWQEMALRLYPEPLASLANSQSHHPPGHNPIAGPGGHLCFQAPLSPLTQCRAFSSPRFIREFGM